MEVYPYTLQSSLIRACIYVSLPALFRHTLRRNNQTAQISGQLQNIEDIIIFGVLVDHHNNIMKYHNSQKNLDA